MHEERDVFEKAKTWRAGGALGAHHRIGTKSKGAVVAEIFKGEGTKVWLGEKTELDYYIGLGRTRARSARNFHFHLCTHSLPYLATWSINILTFMTTLCSILVSHIQHSVSI